MLEDDRYFLLLLYIHINIKQLKGMKDLTELFLH